MAATTNNAASASSSTAEEWKDLNELNFTSRRSSVLSRSAAAASSNPSATAIGVEIMKLGGNCVDACVAMAAALAVLEPTSTGIGGDCFCLYYEASSGSVRGLNASGRSPAALTLEKLSPEERAHKFLPLFSPHAVTVPGAAAGWVDSIEKFGSGKLSLAEILQPAINLAEKGFPVAQIAAEAWKASENQLKARQNGVQMLIGGQRAPKAGEIWQNESLGRTLRLLAEKGKKGFYESEIAREIIKVLQPLGSLMTLEDLKSHENSFPQPISVEFEGYTVWEIPPNGQGITALIGLNILQQYLRQNGPEKSQKGPNFTQNCADHIHLAIESLRLAFADARYYVSDPQYNDIPLEELLSAAYGAERAKLISLEKANLSLQHGKPINSSNTVSFCAVDSSGNACSFINSNYLGFGSCLVPNNCGFTLQNRGANFNLEAGHYNVLAPNKRPYHTIIPSLITRGGALTAAYNCMGGFMQPQGHLQLVLNLIKFRNSPQTALDQPRFCLTDGESDGEVALEEGFSAEVVAELQRRGHSITILGGYQRSLFGRGTIIWRSEKNHVLWSAADGRSDGCAAGY
jgi:gamma-glutamyltranspeptidase/glutathione hydrolase